MSSGSPISGTCCSLYQARISSRSATAEAANVMRRRYGTSGQTETLLDLTEVHLTTRFEVHKALNDFAQERPLLGLGLVAGHCTRASRRRRAPKASCAPPSSWLGAATETAALWSAPERGSRGEQ